MTNVLKVLGRCLTALLLTAAMTASAWADQVSTSPKQRPNFPIRTPADLALCLNCAKLDVRIFSLPGSGCVPCDISQLIPLHMIFDPDLYIENKGTIASLPGTVAIEYYDLVAKSAKNMSVAIPAVQPGSWEAVGLPSAYMVFLGSDGIKMTIDYADANGARHKVRTIRKCPDN